MVAKAGGCNHSSQGSKINVVLEPLFFLPIKGWAPTFRIRGFGLSGKPMIYFWFGFSDLGLTSHKLQLKTKKLHVFLSNVFLISDLFLVYLPHMLQLNALTVFSTWEIT